MASKEGLMVDLSIHPDVRTFPDLMQSCQTIANTVGERCGVPATLIMRKAETVMEVMVASDTEACPYQVGDCEQLSGDLFCEKVMQDQAPLLVANGTNNPHWGSNPAIKLGMVFYYGIPINWPDGTQFGTFCILGPEERSVSEEEKQFVEQFAGVIETLLANVLTNEKLRHLAEYDFLTQVFTRGALLDRLKLDFDRFIRYDTPVSIIYLDIDHFKGINDQFGHSVGDNVLTLLSRTLTDNLRQTDYMGRFGGEEFLICMPETAIDGALIQAERLRKKVEQIDFESTGQSLKVTLSCGVTEAHPYELSLEKMISRADQALYLAKNLGRNRVETG